jgi:hypothetical protein
MCILCRTLQRAGRCFACFGSGFLTCEIIQIVAGHLALFKMCETLSGKANIRHKVSLMRTRPLFEMGIVFNDITIMEMHAVGEKPTKHIAEDIGKASRGSRML